MLTIFSSYAHITMYLEALLRNHTTHKLLFGKDASTDDENDALFLKVQDYILKSKRFVH